MGSGSWSSSSYSSYCKSTGRDYDVKTNRSSGQFYKASRMNEAMNPKNVIRECANSAEHPNTIPIILGLDVTGSMGAACKETAQALSQIVKTLYNRYKDVEIMIMGIGDMVYDSAPLQVGQFESDVRIAADLDKIYIEGGGGGNEYESYTAAWYFGLKHTKLDCYDNQQRKGIIITMGDEPLNPTLHKNDIKEFLGDSVQDNIDTDKLYEKAIDKFDIYHIAVDDSKNCYSEYSGQIKNSFGKLLGQRLMVSTIEKLSDTICDCVENSINHNSQTTHVLNENDTPVINSNSNVSLNDKGEITW